MLTILHGENVTLSRKRRADLVEYAKKQGVKETITLSGKAINQTEVKEAIEARSLFGGERLVMIEDLFSGRESEEKKKVIDYILHLPKTSWLILWESKEINRGTLSLLGQNFSVEIFKIEPLVFKFLDSLRPGNAREALRVLHLAQKTKEPELIFYLLIKRFHLLILTKELSNEELNNLPAWQRGKILDQGKHFTIEQLKSFYHDLLEIDFKRKTAQTPFELEALLDLFVLNL